MTNFDNIQALWNQQPNPNRPQAARAIITRAEASNNWLLAAHRGTLFTLSITVLVVMGYVWGYGTTTERPVVVGSVLMIGSLLLRIGVEYVSYRQFAGIKAHTDLRTCLEQIKSFQRARQRIQLVMTPLSLGSYVWGFTLLLPYVKAGVSEGFYWYILVSGVLFLLFLCVIIYRQIRNELRLLAQLEDSYASLLEP
jgi:hypothetical protein